MGGAAQGERSSRWGWVGGWTGGLITRARSARADLSDEADVSRELPQAIERGEQHYGDPPALGIHVGSEELISAEIFCREIVMHLIKDHLLQVGEVDGLRYPIGGRGRDERGGKRQRLWLWHHVCQRHHERRRVLLGGVVRSRHASAADGGALGGWLV